ncbi:hypothetical protein FA10DRAFT_301316 [Acaromyces ingoldii]|uniref:PH domain-containing protein n=1 Tax=Acaromyces ingoldii TaxID=215250 RepID=A0A316YLG5_9BASI|nr:hypothetical protein FA10DRAFT_301316 [Acaromyces ingoldii]PWN90031.1 hypothetical protein FA10DRAFT_301316 [Acaromyces ingoldii]
MDKPASTSVASSTTRRSLGEKLMGTPSKQQYRSGPGEDQTIDESERERWLITVYVRIVPKDVWIRTKIDVRSSMGAVKDKILAKVKLPSYDPTLNHSFYENVNASRAGSMPKAFVARSPTQTLTNTSSTHLSAPDLLGDNWASPSKPGKGKVKDRYATATDLLGGDPGRGGRGRFGIVTLAGQGHLESMPSSPSFGVKSVTPASSSSSTHAATPKNTPLSHRVARTRTGMSSLNAIIDGGGSSNLNGRAISTEAKASSADHGRSTMPLSDAQMPPQADAPKLALQDGGRNENTEAEETSYLDYFDERDVLKGNQEALRKEQEAMAVLSPTLSATNSSSSAGDVPLFRAISSWSDTNVNRPAREPRDSLDSEHHLDAPLFTVRPQTPTDAVGANQANLSVESLISEEKDPSGRLNAPSRASERERSGTVTAADVAMQRQLSDSLATPKLSNHVASSPSKINSTPSSMRQITRLAGVNLDEISKANDKLQHPMSGHFCLYSYSSGQLLKDHLTVASYRIRPFELLEVQLATPQDRIYLPRSRSRVPPRQPLPNPTTNLRYLEPFCEGYCYVFKPGSGSNKAIKAGLGVWKLRWMSIRGRQLYMHRSKPLRPVDGEPTAELDSWPLSSARWVASERADGVTLPRLKLQSSPDIITIAFGSSQNDDPYSVAQTLSMRCITHLDFSAFFHALARSYLLYAYSHRGEVESTALVAEWRRRALARATIAGQGGTVLPGRAGRRGGRNALSRPRLRPPGVKRDFDNADRWSSASEDESIQTREGFRGFSYGLMKKVEPRQRQRPVTLPGEGIEVGGLRRRSPTQAQPQRWDQTSSAPATEGRDGREKLSMRSRGLSFAQAARDAFIPDSRKKAAAPETPTTRQWRNSGTVIGSPTNSERDSATTSLNTPATRSERAEKSEASSSSHGRSRAHTVGVASRGLGEQHLEAASSFSALSSKASVPSFAASNSSARTTTNPSFSTSTRAALLRSLRPGSKAGPR